MLQEELEKGSLIPRMLARQYASDSKSDEFYIINLWSQWVVNYYQVDGNFYSTDDEAEKAKLFYQLTSGNIKEAISYLEHLCLKNQPISKETWAEFIKNRRM